MNISGIRILDTKNKILDVTLFDILEEITRGSSYCWSILFLEGLPNLEFGEFISLYKNKINNSKNGSPIDWKTMIALSEKFFQMFEIVLIASSNPNLLKSYKEDEEMYRMCDIVIELIDRSFWEVHTRDKALILRLQRKFKQTELLS